jgi:hypothetical protein
MGRNVEGFNEWRVFRPELGGKPADIAIVRGMLIPFQAY